MDTESKVARLESNLMSKCRNLSQHFDYIEDRDVSYLRRGLSQPGGKLPLFDLDGQAFEASVIRRCIVRGWAEPWFSNPLKPDWLVCKLTALGRTAVERALELKSLPRSRAAS